MMRKYVIAAIVAAVASLSCTSVVAAQPVGGHASSTGGSGSATSSADARASQRAVIKYADSASGLTPVAAARQTSGTGWIPGTFPGTYDFVNQVSCWEPGDCLAIGSTGSEDNGSPLATAFVNGVASSAPAPSIASNTFAFANGSLSCTGASFCMLANGANNPTPSTQLYEFNGSSWQPQSTPAVPSEGAMAQVSCASNTLCISVGYSQGPSPLIDEFNGST
jgi:hypothetical protein